MTAALQPRRCTSLVPLMAGVATAETMRASTGIDAKLKWPNDILIDGRKVGGILSESAWSQGEAKYTLLGIGINLNNQLPPTLREATTLSAELGEDVDIDQFIDELLERLDKFCELLETEPRRILDAWRRLSTTLGRRVEVNMSGETIRGVAVDVDQDGALIVETGGERRRVVSGSLRALHR